MSRLPFVDAILVAILVPLWLVALALHVQRISEDGLWWVGVYVAASATAEQPPQVSGFWHGVEADKYGLALGDGLMQLGGVDLMGMGPIELFSVAHEEGRTLWARGEGVASLALEVRKGDALRTTVLPVVPVHAPWRLLPLTAGLGITGLLVLLRRPGSRVARIVFLAVMAFGLHWTWFFGGSRAVTELWVVVFALSSTVMFPLALLAIAIFPDDTAGRLPYWPWLFAVNGPVALTAAIGTPLPPAWGLPAMYVVNLSVIAAILVLLARNYRRAGPIARRQLKWQLYGLYVGLVPVVAADLVILAVPEWWWLHDIGALSELAIPVCLLIGTLRFNLYDVDRLLTSAVAYSILSAFLFGAVIAVVPWLTEIASTRLGIDRGVGASALSGVVAISLFWLYRGISPWLEGILFRERQTLQQGVHTLLEQISSTNSTGGVFGLLGTRLAELFEATSCVVYASTPDGYSPVVVAGTRRRERAPARIAADSGFVRTLAGADRPLEVASAGEVERKRAQARLDRESLMDMPEVVIPVREGGSLAAFVSLGGKGSGDVYLPSDLALLDAVAQRAALALERLETERRTAEAPLLVPRKFELLSRLGEGGMGLVLEVRHRELGSRFALKLLPAHLARSPDLVERFHREAKLTATLRHPNVVRVLDVDVEDDRHYLVMECVDGLDLAAYLRSTGPLSASAAIDLARQIAAGLAHAHGQRPPIVHRDVTPSNVLIESATGRAVVTDFGIAKVLDGTKSGLTRTGEFFGKIRYAAPEQLLGQRDLDARADVYSLGLLIIQMLTGRPPFEGLDEHELIVRSFDPARFESLLQPPADTPPALRELLRAATAPDREARPRDARAMLVALERLAPERSRRSEELPLVSEESSGSLVTPTAEPELAAARSRVAPSTPMEPTEAVGGLGAPQTSTSDERRRAGSQSPSGLGSSGSTPRAKRPA